MSLTIRDSGRRQFTPAPAGTHSAVCVLLADLGVQGGGRYTPRHQVYIGFEISGHRRTWTDPDGKEHTGPMRVGRTYTLSLNAKANLRAHLEMWRGRTFSEAELAVFDLRAILGKCCTLGIVHRESGDSTYANIATVMGPPAGATLKPEGPVLAYDADAPDREVFEQLPRWLQEKIRDRIVPPARAPEPEDSPESEDFDDDIPF